MSATARVLTGLVAGIVIGMLLAWTDPALAATVAGIVEPFGKLWINALQMTVVPLVLSLVIVGVNHASDAAHSGRVARRAIIIFLVLLAGAATMTAVLAPMALSLLQPDPAVAAALRGHEAELPQTTGGWANALTAIVPSNAVAAAAAGAMLPLVTFALFFGFALTR
ncbi:MAG TPA: cation:dicarboxylase symporter family transporter, partial [Thermomonas sp.]|nr:cation:dicarboxylase symporter family transporter [Thermomonas sp.]